MTYRMLLKDAVARLRDANIADPDTDAWILLSWAYEINRTDLLLHGDEELSDVMAQVSFQNAIAERAKHVPVQYITHQAPFMGMTFCVGPQVLIPRFDTEILVEEAICLMKKKAAALNVEQSKLQVLDLCTGSGCIAISVKKLTGCEMTGVDLSAEALEIAKLNERVILQEESELRWIQSDMFDRVEGCYDCILSNPPYIRPEVIATLDSEVKDAEPMMALDGGEDGLDFYRILASKGRDHLKDGGHIILEIGCDQAEDVSRLLSENQYTDVRVVKDLAGLDRVVVATWTWR